MKAIRFDRYGPPEVVHISEVEKPAPKDNELLIKVHAATVNRTDCGIRSGKPFLSRFLTGLARPRGTILGNEFAGEVEIHRGLQFSASQSEEGDRRAADRVAADREIMAGLHAGTASRIGEPVDRGHRPDPAIAVERNIPVLTDEIYRQFLYEGEFASIMNLPGMRERTILLDGFSKSYAMTGWRLGYGVMPVPLAEHVARLMVNSNSCTASFVQLAGIAALQGDQTPVARMVAEFKRRRDILVDGLNRLPGVKCARPRGAFYVFPNITGTGRSSAEVAERLLNEAGVAALSGAAFGAHGEGYLRFSYANSEANLLLALERMRPMFESFART